MPVVASGENPGIDDLGVVVSRGIGPPQNLTFLVFVPASIMHRAADSRSVT